MSELDFDSVGVLLISMFLAAIIVWQYVGWRKQKEKDEQPTEEEMAQFLEDFENALAASAKEQIGAQPLYITQPDDVYCAQVYVGGNVQYKPSIINYFKDKRGERTYTTLGDVINLPDADYVRMILQHKEDCTQWLIDKGYL